MAQASRGHFGTRSMVLLAAAAPMGCVGEIDGVTAGSGTAGPPGESAGGRGSAVTPPAGSPPLAPGSTAVGPAFACGPSKPAVDEGWRRLSPQEYRNTLRDLLAFALKGAAAADAVLASLPLSALPDGTARAHSMFSRADQDVGEDLIRGWYQVAVAAGRALTTPDRLGVLLGACATDANAANDAACLTEFVRRFGERAFRRPLSEDEITFYRGFYGNEAGVAPAGVADVVAGILLAPPFLYLTEHAESLVPGKEGVYALSPFEIASRLSYHFWQTMPDQALWDAARSGALKTNEGYARELDRVFGDARVRKVMQPFFEEWLQLEKLPSLTTLNADAVFKAFAGPDLPKATLRETMIQEVRDMFDHYVWDKGGGLEDLLLGDRVFAKTPELARIYGVSPWQGGEPPQAAERPGFLTRAAFLASGTANSRPIDRGVFIRRAVLCDEVPQPPNGDVPPPPQPSDKATTRQAVEALTEATGTICAGCHATLINPLGFALEGFDALGRRRTEQRLFSKDGKEVARAPVDAASVPRVVSGDARPSRGAGDLMRLVVESGKVAACLARNHFRFTYARQEDPTLDGCALERLRASAAGNRPLRNALRDVALAPEFRERAF